MECRYPLYSLIMTFHWPVWVVTAILVIINLGFTHGACQPDEGIPPLQPEFVQPTADTMELIPGQEADLVCQVTREVDPEYPPSFALMIWWCNSTYPKCHTDRPTGVFEHTYLKKTTSNTANASSLRSTFSLGAVQPSDSNQYYCVAYSDDPKSSKCPGSNAVRVTVKERSDPVIIKHTAMKDVVKGSPFNLSCQATGFPTPVFKWTKDGESEDGGLDGTLYKNEAKEKDKGNYHCQAVNIYASSQLSPKIKVKVIDNSQGGWTPLKYGLLIAGAVVLSILLIVIIVSISKFRSNTPCLTIHRTNVSGDNNRTIHAKNVHVYTDGSSHSARKDSTHERRAFLHMHDVFIHNHSSDKQLALMISSKLTDRESHLKVGLWSDAQRPERGSSRNKLLRLRLLNCSRIVIIVSDNYLKYDYPALLSALAKSRASPQSLRSKIIIVRLLDDNKIPKDLMRDVLTTLEYNVDTDSCYFWPKFLKAAMPDQKEILYWV